MSKHTPGPWIWGDDYRGLFGAGPDNDVLSYAPYEGMWIPTWEEASEANARLIAAAPDMYETLIAVRENLTWETPVQQETYKQVLAAIEKSTGIKQ